jgi:Uma2 family endonuclease
MVARGSRRDFAAEHPTPSQVVVVLEVADSPLQYNLGDKASLYASGGVQELWVLDLNERQLVVLRDPQPDPAARYGWHYRTRITVPPGESVAPLAAPDKPVKVAELLP